MDIRDVESIDTSHGFRFLGVNEERLVGVPVEDMIKTTDAYSSIRNDVKVIKGDIVDLRPLADSVEKIQWVNGRYVDPSNGNEDINKEFSVSKYIILNPHTTYTANMNVLWAIYDADFNYLKGGFNNSPMVFNTGSNSSYLKVSCETNSLSSLVLSYKSIKLRKVELLAKMSTHNIINDLLYDNNKAWNHNTKNKISVNGWKAYEPIPIEKGVTYTLTGFYPYYCSIEDSNGNITSLSNSTTPVQQFDITPTSNSMLYLSTTDEYAKPYVSLTTNKKINENREFKVGINKEYTTLRSAIEEAIKYKNSIVYVEEGNYDLCNEFYSEISSSKTNLYGLPLSNGIHIIFSPNAKVMAIYNGTDTNVYRFFNPFYTIGGGGFIIENLNIVVKNVRYCVHDDREGRDEWHRNIFKNCYMEYQGNSSQYRQCIGGGNAKNSYVEIDNCVFKGESSLSNSFPLVAYHNNNLSSGKSKIVIKNSYFHDKGTCQVTLYGSSNEVSEMIINNCSLGSTPIKDTTSLSHTTDNFNIISWNNEIRS